jgi:hypothetical protein
MARNVVHRETPQLFLEGFDMDFGVVLRREFRASLFDAAELPERARAWESVFGFDSIAGDAERGSAAIAKILHRISLARREVVSDDQ